MSAFTESNSAEQFMCKQCSKVFYSRGRYNQHRKRHAKSHQCDACPMVFATRPDLTRHRQARHRVGNQRFNCSACQLKFSRKDNLRKHIRNKKCPRSTEAAPALREAPSALGLCSAASGGFLRLVQSFIEHGADISLQADDGSTPLHCAARAGHTDVLELLLTMGSDLTILNRNRCTPRDEAIKGGHIDAVRLIFHSEEWNYHRYLLSAIKHQHFYLITEFVSMPQFQKVREDSTLLIEAVESRNASIITLLLNAGFNPHGMKSGLIYAAIRLASTLQNEDTARKLFFLPGISARIRNPLHTAVRYQLVSVVQTNMNQRNVKLNSRDVDGRTPLHVAIETWNSSPRCLSIFRLLLSHPNIEVNLRPKWGPGPALFAACHGGHAEAVKLLLNHSDIQVNVVDPYGTSALHKAVYFQRLEVVKVLLRHPGIDIHARVLPRLYRRWEEIRHENALEIAMIKGNQEIVDLLLAHGASTNHDELQRERNHMDLQVGGVSISNTEYGVGQEDSDMNLCMVLGESHSCGESSVTTSDVGLSSVEWGKSEAVMEKNELFFGHEPSVSVNC